MSAPLVPPARWSDPDTQRAVERDYLIQGAIASILRVALEPVCLEKQLERLLELIVNLDWLPFDHRGCIFLYDEAGKDLVMAAQVDMPEGALAACGRVPVGRCICGRALAEKKILFKSCLDEHHCTRYPGITPHGHYCVPLLSRRRHVGILNLYVREGHVPSPMECQFLRAVGDVLAGVIERGRAEQALRQSEERFELAARGTDAGIWDRDVRAGTVFYSSHWKGLLGYRDDEIGGQPAEWESRIHPEDRDRALRTLRDYLEGRSAEFELEYRLRHKDGSYRWFLGRGAAVCDPQGRPYRVVGSDLDVTERKRVEDELRQRVASLAAAGKILEHLLPRGPLEASGFVLRGASAAADYAQGDFFDYFTLGDGAVVAAVADVSGHGVDAALLVASLHARLRSLAEVGLGIDEVLRRTNAAFADQTDREHFVTAVVLVIDPGSRSLVYANAGHPAGLVFDRTGQVRSSLDSLSLPLGIEPQGDFPVAGPCPLESGDLIVLFTDGAFEARAPDGSPYGLERLTAVLRGQIGRPADAIIAGVYAAIRDFAGTDVLPDDVTMVLINVP